MSPLEELKKKTTPPSPVNDLNFCFTITTADPPSAEIGGCIPQNHRTDEYNDTNGNTMMMYPNGGRSTESASPRPDSGEVAASGSGEANVEQEETVGLDTSQSTSAATAPEHRPTQREEARGNGQTGEGSDRIDSNPILEGSATVLVTGCFLMSMMADHAPDLMKGIEACKAVLKAGAKALLEAMGL